MRRLFLSVTILFLSLPVWSQAEAGKYVFEHIQTPNHWINDIFQDNDGFIWLTTRTGLYRYFGDGSNDFDAVYEGDIFYDICQDADGLMWIRRRGGLIIYDPRTRSFTDETETARILDSERWIDRFTIDRWDNWWWCEQGSIYYRTRAEQVKTHVGEVNGTVVDICCRNGMTYVLTDIGELYRYSLDTEVGPVALRVLAPLEEPASAEQSFSRVFVDSQNNIWLSQGAHGVWLYRFGSEIPLHLRATDKVNAIQRGFIRGFEEDAEGNVWLASDHGGICICSKEGKVLTHLIHDSKDDKSLASNGIYAICRDKAGNIWIGHTKLGLSVYKGENKTWEMSHIRSLHDNDLPEDVNNVCEDKDGNLWFGMDGNGLIRLERATGKETRYTRENSPLRSNVITSLHCDSDGRIWIGTFYGGMSCYENGRMSTFAYDPSGNGLASENVWAIDSDSAGRIWIGTLGGGLQMYDPEKGGFITYTSQSNGLANDDVLSLTCAEDGNVYVATAYGMSVLDTRTGIFATVCEPDEMVQESVTGILVDSEGLVWLDENGSLQVYDLKKGRLYTPEHPALTTVRSLIKDASGRVWAVNDRGLCKVSAVSSGDDGLDFNVVSFSFLQQSDLHFNQRSACLTKDGDFVIGSFSGYLRFSPERYVMDDSHENANLHFVDLYVGNMKIVPGEEYDGEVILDKALEYTGSVTLRHDQSLISVEFSSLDYLSVLDRTFYYRMEGLSDEWIAVDKNFRRLTFTSMRPGRYRLVLTPDMSDPDDGISLNFRVLPPWWATWWALLAYMLVLVLSAYVAWTVMARREMERQKQLEHDMMQERRHYVDEMKMQFFTNVSHDFRTPLTLILTPLEERMAQNPELKDDLLFSTIHRNARRLLNLVNEVLDLRKMEMYGTELSLGTSDLIQLVKDSVASFNMMAENQSVDLQLVSDMDTLTFDMDGGKIVKVLTNLLSNAFKFTPVGGYVHVEVRKENDSLVRISVKDTGCGIPDSDKRRIFERFYQPKDSPAGSGIGLHIVREFVLLHGGEVEVLDNKPAGSIFTFTIPVRMQEAAGSVHDEDGVEMLPHEKQQSGERPVVLIVDDEPDFRSFMSASLKEEYEVICAGNGSDALKIVKSSDHDIDVVVSDVMMPVMDGTELCRRMKSDIDTSHIPVILLTAKSLQDDECRGLESGADDYLTKPFNMSILRLRIAKFIEWKKRAKRLFEQELEITTDQITLTSMDDRLLQQAINVINENISNPDFSVSDLSAALCMHRTSLYKKLLYITGKTPVEFIRALRLKRAASLLETDGVYVSEIAYNVGFNSPKVFTSHFKEEFGCSPTEYRKNHAKS